MCYFSVNILPWECNHLFAGSFWQCKKKSDDFRCQMMTISLTKARHYSQVPNKRTGLNKRTGSENLSTIKNHTSQFTKSYEITNALRFWSFKCHLKHVSVSSGCWDMTLDIRATFSFSNPARSKGPATVFTHVAYQRTFVPSCLIVRTSDLLCYRVHETIC